MEATSSVMDSTDEVEVVEVVDEVEPVELAERNIFGAGDIFNTVL